MSQAIAERQVIRDDRGKGRHTPPEPPTFVQRMVAEELEGPDGILYDCPDCGREHLVTIGDCPR